MNQFSEETPNPQWSSGHFREAAVAPGTSPLGRGLVGHVPIVALLMIVQGLFEIIFGIMCLGFMALIQWVPEEDLAQMKPLTVVAGILSVPALVCGGLQMVAGYQNYFFRRRVFGIVALLVGLLAMLTAYCAPTAIALAIYGLIVYINEPVVAAFELAKGGRTPAEIQAAFPATR